MDDSQLSYKIAEVALSYAALCGVLAGFAFTSLFFLMYAQGGSQNNVESEKTGVLNEVAEVMILAFFGLVAAAVLQTIRSGSQVDDGPWILGMTFIVDHEMIISIFLMFSGLLMMAIWFLRVDTEAKKRLRLFFHAIAGIALLLSYLTVVEFWESLLPPLSITTISVLGLVLTIGAYLLAMRWQIKFGTFINLLLASIVISCIVDSLVWSYRNREFRYDIDYIWVFLSLLTLVSEGLLAGWMYHHFIVGVEKTPVVQTSVAQVDKPLMVQLSADRVEKPSKGARIYKGPSQLPKA